MATINQAAKNWAARVSSAGGLWLKGVQSPRRSACDAFKDFVGTNSIAVQKYCQDYGQFLSNASSYEANFTSGVQKAITNNTYQTGLSR